jgi:tetratricopeptide (TPR) repeat protein
VIEVTQDTAVYTNRGLAKSDLGDVKGALADFDKALELDPDNAGAYGNRGNTRSAMGDLQGALADFDHLLKLDPQSAPTYNNRGVTRRAMGDLKSAVADYTQALELDPKYAAAYYNRGHAKDDGGDGKGALADLDKALELDPESFTAYVYRGQARGNQGDLDGALADYSKAMELNSENLAVPIGRGVIFARQGKWVKAFGDFDAVIRADPSDFYTALYRCAAQMRFEQAAAAKTALRQVVENEKEPGEWNSKIAGFLLGEIDEKTLLAAAETSDAETTREHRCEAWFFAGIAQFSGGKKDAAADCFRKCLATEAKDLEEYRMAEAELGRMEAKK